MAMRSLCPSVTCTHASPFMQMGHAQRLVAAHAAAPPRPPPGVPQLGAFDLSTVAATAAADVESALDVDALEKRDVRETSYISRQRMYSEGFDPNEVDSEGLPLVYNEEQIANFWKLRPGELAARWTRFAGISIPWLTSLSSSFLRGTLEADQARLARRAVDNLEQLGPTFIKMGQLLSIRPDVLPPPVLKELAKLQDKIKPFSTAEARRIVEEDLGAPIEEVFSSFSEKPVAAASLAQVYRATLVSTGQEVAVKVQRPGALSTISKDLYVLRRAVGVYEAILASLTPQRTDYQQLISTFAEGLYTEMDFRNEALNMVAMRARLDRFEYSDAEVVIPEPLLHLSTRRVLVMEWITGVKLTELEPADIQSLVKVGQETFLVQLLEIGFFHGDPHPGNLLRVSDGPNAGKLALLDFGLVAEIPERDRESMVSSVIHLANKDWTALIEDFVTLGFLPANCDRAVIIPVMERVLSPYLRGGGAAAFNFQALSQDLLAVTLEIPFSVPPYMAVLARAVATLEGIALYGDPQYQMVAQAYPFVVRKVLRNETDSLSAVLRAILFTADGSLQPARLSTLLNAALGYVSESQGGFIDFDAVPADGASTRDIVSFILSKEASELRTLLISEFSTGTDLLIRDRVRKGLALSTAALQPRLPLIGTLPAPPLPPIIIPGAGVWPVDAFVDIFFPRLTDQQEVLLDTQLQLAYAIFGVEPSRSIDIASVQEILANPDNVVRSTVMQVAADSTERGILTDAAAQVGANVADLVARRGGLAPERLFPGLSLTPLGLRARSQRPLQPLAPPATSTAPPPATAEDDTFITTNGDGIRLVRL